MTATGISRALRTAPVDGPVLVTGFPNFVARRLIARLIEVGDRVWVLVQKKFAHQVEAFGRECEASLRAKDPSPPPGAPPLGSVEVLIGDVCDMDLGLDGAEACRVLSEVREVHHLAGIYYLGADAARTRHVNVDGTRMMLEMARSMRRLCRFNHWSTAFVSGTRSGVVMEHELDARQGFHNTYERTKFDAERLMRAAANELPVTILRPSLIVGDSHSGEIDRLDGPYFLVSAIVNAPENVPIPLPGSGKHPLNLVPVDFVVDAGIVLGRNPATVGLTFHLTDPSPLSAREVFDLVADAAGRARPSLRVPAGLARLLLRVPGIAQRVPDQRALIDNIDAFVMYHCRNTIEHLSGTGVYCPPLQSYVSTLVRWVRDNPRRVQWTPQAASQGAQA